MFNMGKNPLRWAGAVGFIFKRNVEFTGAVHGHIRAS
jgi:hypothetical protein